jgi:hypothetical protein
MENAGLDRRRAAVADGEPLPAKADCFGGALAASRLRRRSFPAFPSARCNSFDSASKSPSGKIVKTSVVPNCASITAPSPNFAPARR